MISRRYLRIKTFQALYAYFHSGSENRQKTEKELFLSIERMYDLYLLLLTIHSDLSHLAQLKMEEAKQKRLPTEDDLHPNMKFVENAAFQSLANNSSLQSLVNAKKLYWNNDQELLGKLFNFIRKHPVYLEYMSTKTSSFEMDKKFAVDLYKKIMAENDFFISEMSEKSIYWGYDEIDFVLSMVIKTIKKLEAKGTNSNVILNTYNDEEDDTEFVKTLFRTTIDNNEAFAQLIANKTKNWEVERIATVDILLMKMALSELKAFKSIPVKVTLNEYIDLSKSFSTPKSKIFVNGILDKLIADLNQQGEIKKTGRGLM
ncbi:MAG TPA: transcription antitermination factor NusB [Vicingaceae bacterium]|jgi:N utilization substance protein B|nr:transcription antitermination factor NusB [Vicingaceae bacterium]